MRVIAWILSLLFSTKTLFRALGLKGEVMSVNIVTTADLENMHDVFAHHLQTSLAGSWPTNHQDLKVTDGPTSLH